MALPKEPRQKMINLMYLVLTALLALNVSSEILNAFRTVNNSLVQSNNMIDAKNKTILQSIDAKLADQKTAERAAIWKPKADQAKQLADATYNYINELKAELKKEAGLTIENGEEVYKEDNLEAATRLMDTEGKGQNLYNELKKYKDALLNIDPAIKEQFQNSLPIDLTIPKTKNKGNNDWASVYFRMTPAIAAVTILTKFQNDVKNAESQVIDFCHNKIGQVEVVYDQFEPFVGTNSTYLMSGQPFEVTLGIGSFSSKALPEIRVNGQSLLVQNGKAVYKEIAGGVGSRTIPYSITYTKPDGTKETVSKTIEYRVGASNIAVSLNKMNVLFIGVDNPLTISAAGMGSEQVSASISSGSLSRGSRSGEWIARVNSEGEATITVTAGGKSIPIKYRVRSIPDPVPMVGASKGGDISASVFKSQQGVRATLENFFFDAKFSVTGFKMTADGAGFDELTEVSNGGAAWSGGAQNIVNKCRPGSFITIEDIRVVGPDGRTRKLSPMLFNLK